MNIPRLFSQSCLNIWIVSNICSYKHYCSEHLSACEWDLLKMEFLDGLGMPVFGITGCCWICPQGSWTIRILQEFSFPQTILFVFFLFLLFANLYVWNSVTVWLLLRWCNFGCFWGVWAFSLMVNFSTNSLWTFFYHLFYWWLHSLNIWSVNSGGLMCGKYLLVSGFLLLVFISFHLHLLTFREIKCTNLFFTAFTLYLI